MATLIWTIQEQLNKTHTVQQAVDAAKIKAGGKNVCLDSIKRRDRNEKITLVELNHLADLILLDTVIRT